MSYIIFIKCFIIHSFLPPESLSLNISNTLRYNQFRTWQPYFINPVTISAVAINEVYDIEYLRLQDKGTVQIIPIY